MLEAEFTGVEQEKSLTCFYPITSMFQFDGLLPLDQQIMQILNGRC